MLQNTVIILLKNFEIDDPSKKVHNFVLERDGILNFNQHIENDLATYWKMF